MANTIIEYLSLTGLQKYDVNIKNFIEEKVAEGDAKSFKYVNLEDGVLKFYTVNPITEDTVADFEIELPEQDLSNLMQLVTDATSGNVAIFDNLGQVSDSGLAAADLAVKSEVADVQSAVDTLDAYVGDIPEGYTETTIIGYINKKAEETLNSASGGSSESAASVLAALNTYKSENDAKVTANTTGVAEAKAAAVDAQAAADAAQEHSEGVAADLATAVESLEGADADQIERIEALEGTIVGLSGAMHFEGVKDAIPEDVTGYEAGDVIIVGNKEYVFNDGAFVEFGDASVNAEAITALTNRVDTAEADVEALETLHATDKAELVAADEAMAADIAALKEVQHVEITEEQIDALFVVAE